MYYNYSDLNYINQELNGVWPGWFAVRLLGRGAFGAVYEIQRNVRGNLEKAAMKVLRVPDSDAEIARIQFQGMTWQNTEEYYEKYVDGIHNEIRIMQSFVGNSHIVSYEDYSIRKRYNQIGWDLYIRMELLAGLPDYMKTHSFDEKMTVRLGMDIAQGLRDCHNAGIIHRDVKPENIFVNKVGNFKLGDFGISRNAPGSHDVLSFKGTLAYMAPEVYRMLSTDARSDIYSLGMVLYQCLNDNRLPFVPSKFSPFDIETARQRRFAGEPIPAPAHGSRALKNIVLRALEERPEDRFQTAEELYFELMEVYRADYGTGRRVAGSASRVGRNEYSRDYNYDKSAERKAEYGARETVLLEDVSPAESNLIAEEEPSGKSGRVEEESLVEITLKEEVEPPVDNNRGEEESLVESSLKAVEEPPVESTCEEVEEISKVASDYNANQVEKSIPPQQEQKRVFHESEVIKKRFTGQAAAETMHEYLKLAVLIIGIVLFLFATRMYYSGQNEDYVIEWNDAALEAKEEEFTDYAIDWNDAALEAKMREITGISTGDIMYSDVKNITKLDLSNPYGTTDYNVMIKDVSALSNLTNLTELNLYNNQISDISVLSGLTNLKLLCLTYNQISDISVLGNLTNLTKLELWGNQISDISVLSGLRNLTELDLGVNQISDISVLSNLTNLTKLELWGNQISDISVLSGLRNLTELHLRENPISDISVLGRLTNLTVLELSYPYDADEELKIKDISVLSGLTNLTSLKLRNNQINDISVLERLTNLTELDLWNNPISDFSAIRNLVKMTNLGLGAVEISDISVLSNLTNLTSLYLSNNEISDISTIRNMTKLTNLYLGGNEISDISVLSNLTNLKSLDLSNNEISDISALSSLTNLVELDLFSNQVSDINPLSNLTNLTRLVISINPINDYSPIEDLNIEKLTK